MKNKSKKIWQDGSIPQKNMGMLWHFRIFIYSYHTIYHKEIKHYTQIQEICFLKKPRLCIYFFASSSPWKTNLTRFLSAFAAFGKSRLPTQRGATNPKRGSRVYTLQTNMSPKKEPGLKRKRKDRLPTIIFSGDMLVFGEIGVTA